MSEKKPIIKVWLWRPTEAWYELSQEERDRVMEEDGIFLKKIGAKSILTGQCYWSNEEWAYFGVQEYPDIEAVQKHAEYELEREYLKYGESKTYLGTRTE